MLINECNVPYFEQSKLSWLTNWNIGEIYDFNDKDYFAIQFLDPSNYTVEDLKKGIPEEIILKIQNKEIILVLGNQLESFHLTVDFAYDLLINQLSIPEEQILLLTSSPNIVETIKIISKKYNKKEITAIWCRIYEYTMAMHEFFILNTKQPNKLDNIFTKKFICLNRRWRPHRAALVALLESSNLIDEGYVSLGECEGGNWQDMYPWLLDLNKDTEFHNIFRKNKERILNIPDLYVDTDVLEQNIPEFRTTLSKFYQETLFSVITETPYYSSANFDNGIMTSEKTFKAISQYHPFIMVNRPFALKALRSIGYKTFSPYINESYDNEVNDTKRLLLIVEEINRLCNLSDIELKEFILNTQYICEHNYKNMVKFIELNFHNKQFKLNMKYSTRLN